MFPLGHLAFAYLWYVTYSILARRSLPASWPLLPLAVGSQVPDLIDKPLAYYGLLASGRSAGHSVVIALVVVGLVAVGARVLGRHTPSDGWRGRLCAVTPVAFALGYVSHLVGDAIGPLLAGSDDELSFLLWPFMAPPQYTGDAVAPWIRLLEVYMQPHTHPDVPVILAAGVVFAVIRVRAAYASDTRSSDPEDH